MNGQNRARPRKRLCATLDPASERIRFGGGPLAGVRAVLSPDQFAAGMMRFVGGTYTQDPARPRSWRWAANREDQHCG